MNQWHNKSGKFYGLGQGKKDGPHHWWIQRLTSIALIPLSIWFVVSFFNLRQLDYDVIRVWVDLPLTQTLLALWVGITAWHAYLGVQVVIEDYVHKPALHYFLLVTTKFVLAFLAIIGIVYIVGV